MTDGDDAEESSAPGSEPAEAPASGSDPDEPVDLGGEQLGTPTGDAAPAAGPGEPTRRTISPRVRLVWAIPVVVAAIVVLFGGSAVTANVAWLPAWLAPVGGLALLVVGSLWIEARYRVWAFEVRADALYLERGVVTHVRTIAPYVRIQHVDTQRGPVERWLGLSTLVVYTAGSRGADVSIPGLEPDEASELQARVKQLAIEAEGGDAV